MPRKAATARKPKEEKKRYRSFSEVYEQATQIEGEKIGADDLIDAGDEFVIELGDGEMRYFNTASASLMDQLERTEDAMPYTARLVTKTSGRGRSYVSLE